MKADQERTPAFRPGTQAAHRVALLAVLCAGVALSACTTMGTGSGSASPGGAPVTFSWKSTNGGISGTMSATLADKRTFSGRYVEGTRQARTEDADSPWTDRDRGWIDWRGASWADWDGWSPFPEDWYATQYSGRVVANLQAVDGQRMRCNFELNTPVDGMGGGGQGKCQLENGDSLDAVFPRGSTKLGKR
jgi:hypothetical protein